MAGEARNLKVRIDHVSKVYETRNGPTEALRDVSLDICENEFICVVGPSGCGKSTLLNIIAGLQMPTSGKAYCNDHEITGTGTERGVVFQQYALFPWLTVKKNVMFALNMRGVKGAAAETEALEYLKKVDLEKFANFNRMLIITATGDKMKGLYDDMIKLTKQKDYEILIESHSANNDDAVIFSNSKVDPQEFIICNLGTQDHKPACFVVVMLKDK